MLLDKSDIRPVLNNNLGSIVLNTKIDLAPSIKRQTS